MMKMILYLLLLLLFGEIEGTLEDCTANKCLFCLELTPASCDVDLDVMENGAILQYTINCTAPPECVSMPVSNSYGPDSEYCAAIVNILLVGDVGTDTKWLYQASELHIPPPINEDNRTCEDIVLRHEFETNPLTPDCTALSKNCSTATSSLSGCLSQLVCFCYNDDCGASIHATVTIFNDTDTTTTSTTPPSTTATHTPTATSISPSSTYMYMYTASTSSSTLSDKGISSGAISYTSTTSILPSDTNNDSLNETGTLCSTVPFLNPIFLGITL